MKSQPWEVPEDVADKLIPRGGFLGDLLDYTRECTHAPLWYQVGAALAMMITALGYRELRVMHANKRTSYVPLNFWTMIIGNSGDGKDSAVRPLLRILRKARRKAVLAGEFTQEAMLSELAKPDVSGVGLIYKGELSHLFQARHRSYMRGLEEWLLAAYNGDPLERITMSSGEVAVMRPRLSLIGSTPPDVLQRSLTRSDWRSGLMPRLTPFAAQRERWLPAETSDEDAEEHFAQWLRLMCIEDESPIILPTATSRVITQWSYEKLELSRDSYPPDVYSALHRLEEKAFRIAAAIGVSESNKLPNERNGSLRVKPKHALSALEIIEPIRHSVLSLFNLVGADLESGSETAVLNAVIDHPGITMTHLARQTGLSRYKLRQILRGFEEEGEVASQTKPASDRGGVLRGYFARPDLTHQ